MCCDHTQRIHVLVIRDDLQHECLRTTTYTKSGVMGYARQAKGVAYAVQWVQRSHRPDLSDNRPTHWTNILNGILFEVLPESDKPPRESFIS